VTQRIKFKDVRHIVHVGIIILVVLAGFVIARWVSVPKSFGQYGHYRGKSIEERMNLDGRDPLVIFRSAAYCLDCHEEESGEVWVGAEYWQEGKHSANTCLNCHSKAAPGEEKSPCSAGFVRPRDTSNNLCLMCHGVLAARPRVPEPYDKKRHIEEHDEEEGQTCIECHVPHYPAI